MVQFGTLLFFAVYTTFITTGSGTGSLLTKYVTSKDDNLGIQGYLLFHDYRFKESSNFASELISTMMNYNVELGQLVRSYARDLTSDNESYNEKNDECYRKLIESAWFSAIKPDLISRLASILINLIEKDTKLANRADLCGEDNLACIEHAIYRGRIEIGSYGNTELFNELKIKQEYLGKIKHEMDTCLNPDKSGKNEEEVHFR